MGQIDARSVGGIVVVFWFCAIAKKGPATAQNKGNP